MLAPVENVAVLTLVYRTMYRNRYQSYVSLDEHLEEDRDRVSLLGMIGSNALQPADWELVELMGECPFPVDAGPALSEWSAFRAEALLHAWPDDLREQLAGEEWAEPFVERWDLVAMAINGFEPVTWDRERKRDVYVQVSGRSLADVFDEELAKES